MVASNRNEMAGFGYTRGLHGDEQQTPARRYHVFSLYLDDLPPRGPFLFVLLRAKPCRSFRRHAFANVGEHERGRLSRIVSRARKEQRRESKRTPPPSRANRLFYDRRNTPRLRHYLVMLRGSVKTAKRRLMLIQEHWKARTNSREPRRVVFRGARLI